jgi:hypothetical protein
MRVKMIAAILMAVLMVAWVGCEKKGRKPTATAPTTRTAGERAREAGRSAEQAAGEAAGAAGAAAGAAGRAVEGAGQAVQTRTATAPATQPY